MTIYSNNNRRLGINLVIFTVVIYILFRFTFDYPDDEQQPLAVIIIPGGGLTPEGTLPDYGRKPCTPSRLLAPHQCSKWSL